ncbi:hypothetical protein E0I61_15595 [Flavobacterium ranwuense]|uniref:Lipoprotein n=1 Tax=Flavobacterium ranwuense TaxID=2541725 RepID=A0ABY2DSL9_9FLAO|nr:hypothetical protein [Flavobacterium ranwuense]TDE27069.1 hypothetical protein E0I61_15595 [Flavobacterium ranwuense]
MKNIILLFVLTLLSCNTKKNDDLIREKESIIIIQTLIEEKGLEMVSDFRTEKELPICLNLKKVIVKTKCFEETKANDKITVIKFPEKSFTNQAEVCIEKIYKSRPINNSFFLKNDSLNIVNQNETFKAFKIPKSITQKFKTVELTKSLKITEKYIQFSIPIFSKDNTKAYLEFDHYSDNENSYGRSIYLEKVNGKWKIKYIERNWAI